MENLDSSGNSLITKNTGHIVSLDFLNEIIPSVLSRNVRR